MPPHWVKDLYGYWEWLDRQVIGSGGVLLARDRIEPDAYYESDDADDEAFSILDIRNHHVVFYDEHFLKFSITANQNLDLIFYEFHYAAIGGEPMIWRACKNGHRVEALGSECHVHIGPDRDRAFAADEIDLDLAIEAAHDRTIPGFGSLVS